MTFYSPFSSQLKAAVLAKLEETPKGELCLIFAGKILKDDDSLESQGKPILHN